MDRVDSRRRKRAEAHTSTTCVFPGLLACAWADSYFGAGTAGLAVFPIIPMIPYILLSAWSQDAFFPITMGPFLWRGTTLVGIFTGFAYREGLGEVKLRSNLEMPMCFSMMDSQAKPRN